MKENSVNIREATIEDVDKIWAVEKVSFPSPWSRDSFLKEISTNSLAHYYVVELENELVGYGGVWIILDEAHITNVAISPKARGFKLGKLIMQYIMAMARILGAKRMTLEVRVSNDAAKNLYYKLGFKDNGIRKKYYADTNEDALIMWVSL